MHVLELISKLHGIISLQYSGLMKIVMRILFTLRSWFYDMVYHGVKSDLFVRLLEEWRRDVLPRLHYEVDTFDCDDYAMYFSTWAKMRAREEGVKANGFGVAIGTVCVQDSCGGHAWSIAIVDDHIVFIEPQLAEILIFDRNEKVFKASDKAKYWLQAVII